MADPDVPPDEMRWFRSSSDPIDAMFSDDPDAGDIADLAEICHELRSAYLPTEPLRRSPALAAFTQAPLDDKGDLPVTAGSNAHGSALQMAGLPNQREPFTRRRQRMLSSVSAFVATLTGKVVLGTAMAAASVGGLHAAGAVDVPGLPDQVEEAAEHADDGAANEAEGQEMAELDAATAYADAVREWTECVTDGAAAQGDESTRTTAEFDPSDRCGDRPEPGDFGLDDGSDPSSADVQAHPEDEPGDEVPFPTGDPTGNDPTGSDADTRGGGDPTGNDPTGSSADSPYSDPTGNDPTGSSADTPSGDPTGTDPTGTDPTGTSAGSPYGDTGQTAGRP